VLIRKAPLDAVEFAVANMPTTVTKKRLDLRADAGFIAAYAHRSVERDLVDFYRA